MKKVLYITNIRVPYRVDFFNELSQYCDLTVLFERSVTNNRNKQWTDSVKEKYKSFYLDGLKVGNESSFSFKIIRYILQDFDCIILGCYSTPVQIFANLFMRILNKPFLMNFDGEIFLEEKSLKTFLKKIVISGADGYLIAGESAASNLKKVVKETKKMTPYYFSSLFENELRQNSITVSNRENYVLVVGQYFNYKGLDIAVEVAKRTPHIAYKFVGMGKRTALFREELNIDAISNIEVIDFLQKKDLEKEYARCKMLFLPSRQECWGLVINEAASYGTPIVATKGAGAAVEFLGNTYSKYLAKAQDVDELVKIINTLHDSDNTEYGLYLLEKSKKYSIEMNVRQHLAAMEG